MSECKPLPSRWPQLTCTCCARMTPCSASSAAAAAAASAASSRGTSAQGLTLVHFSGQHTRFLLDGGCIEGLSRGCLGGVGAYQGVCRLA